LLHRYVKIALQRQLLETGGAIGPCQLEMEPQKNPRGPIAHI
jgi:hypothetical protein